MEKTIWPPIVFVKDYKHEWAEIEKFVCSIRAGSQLPNFAFACGDSRTIARKRLEPILQAMRKAGTRIIDESKISVGKEARRVLAKEKRK